MVQALLNEIKLRAMDTRETLQTIYLGGGTPSLLDLDELNALFETIYKHYSVADQPEITLEANPDDLSFEKLTAFKSTPINRLSIGVQSFFEEDLRLMNRAHNAKEAINSVRWAKEQGFSNITIDLIYGGQTTTDAMWEKNLETALALDVPHISAYALTLEPKTILDFQVKHKLISKPDEDKQERQFRTLCQTLTTNGFIQYEISNFGKEGYFSQHNSNYWNGQTYLGIGPSAHSFDGKNRSWNVSNNAVYIKSLKENTIPLTIESLSENDRFNELVMIGLRTIYGIDLNFIQREFPTSFYEELNRDLLPLLRDGLVKQNGTTVTLTEKGKFLADGIASNLFKI